MTRLSCRRFRSNQVRLALSLLACNLGNLWRRLGLPRGIENWSLFFARMGVGVGEATLSPAAFSLITDYFPRELLGTAISIYLMGIFIGSGLALAIGGMVIDAVTRLPALRLPLVGMVASWRLIFLMLRPPGLVVAVLIFTLREPARWNRRAAYGNPAACHLCAIQNPLRNDARA